MQGESTSTQYCVEPRKAANVRALIGPQVLVPVMMMTSRGNSTSEPSKNAPSTCLSYTNAASNSYPKSSSAVQLVLLITSAGRFGANSTAVGPSFCSCMSGDTRWGKGSGY